MPASYYLFVTQDVVSRCFPFSDSAVAGERLICTTPACTSASLNASLGGTVSCTTVDAYPEVQTAWELCTEGTSESFCNQQRAACNLVRRRPPPPRRNGSARSRQSRAAAPTC